MQESFPPEHSSELFRDPLEQLLDSGAVTNEGGSHLQSSGWDVANSCLHIVGDPLNKVRAVLVLNVEHLFIDLLHGHTTTEHGGDCKVSAVTRVAGSHHVLSVKHLLG